MQGAWPQVTILGVDAEVPRDVRVGESFPVRCWVSAGNLSPEDLAVQVILGPLDEHHHVVQRQVVPMVFEAHRGDGAMLFAADVPCTGSGAQGFTVRVEPHHELLAHPHGTGLIRWAL